MSDQQNKAGHNLFGSLTHLDSEELKEIELRLKEVKERTSDFVRSYPLTSVAIGIGVGFFIGKLFSKK